MKMMEKRLRTPADAKPPEAVPARPFQYFRQFRPVGDILEREAFDGGAGHNQGVEKLVTDILEPAIEAAQISGFRVTRRVGGRCHENQFNLKRRIAKKAGELDLRFPLLRHQVQQQQPQRPDILAKRLPAAPLHRPALPAGLRGLANCLAPLSACCAYP